MDSRDMSDPVIGHSTLRKIREGDSLLLAGESGTWTSTQSIGQQMSRKISIATANAKASHQFQDLPPQKLIS